MCEITLCLDAQKVNYLVQRSLGKDVGLLWQHKAFPALLQNARSTRERNQHQMICYNDSIWIRCTFTMLHNQECGLTLAYNLCHYIKHSGIWPAAQKHGCIPKCRNCCLQTIQEEKASLTCKTYGTSSKH